jgi:single-strand DNA-binding protein
MPSMNKVLLIGNLTRDPEVRYTPSGTAVAQLRLAVNRRFRDRDNNWRDNTVFLDVEVWGRQAEALSQQVKKGWSVFVDGHLKMDEWTSKDGTKRSKLVVSGLSVMALGAPSGKGAAAAAQAETEEGAPPAPQKHEAAEEENIAPEEDEPPF